MSVPFQWREMTENANTKYMLHFPDKEFKFDQYPYPQPHFSLQHTHIKTLIHAYTKLWGVMCRNCILETMQDILMEAFCMPVNHVIVMYTALYKVTNLPNCHNTYFAVLSPRKIPLCTSRVVIIQFYGASQQAFLLNENSDRDFSHLKTFIYQSMHYMSIWGILHMGSTLLRFIKSFLLLLFSGISV